MGCFVGQFAHFQVQTRCKKGPSAVSLHGAPQCASILDARQAMPCVQFLNRNYGVQLSTPKSALECGFLVLD